MALELVRINTTGMTPEQLYEATNQKLENLVQQLNMKLLLFDDQDTNIIETRKTILTVEMAQSEFEQVVTNNIAAIDGNIYKIHGDLADYKKVVAQELTAVDGYIETLRGNFTKFKTGEFETLKTKALTTETADIRYANLEEFEAVSGKVGTLEGDFTKFKKGEFGQISSEFSNSVASMIGDGYITNAMIKELNFDKITGFDVNTTNLVIHSGDGKSQWKDNTIQIRDANRIRVQIGKDGTGDYSLSAWDAVGNLMFDARGVKAAAIKDQIIRDDMVSEDANISAGKLDKDSLFKVLNEDGSHTLKATRVYFDDEQQTLDLLFNAMTTDIANAQDAASSALTNLSITNGKVSTLIRDMENVGVDLEATKTLAEQTSKRFSWIVKSGTSASDFTLTDRVAELTAEKINLNGLVTFGGLDSAAQEKINDALSTAEQAISETVVKVDVLYALGTSPTVAPTTGWNSVAPEWANGKYMWQKTVTSYGDSRKTESTPTCISGAKGGTGAAGQNGRGIASTVINYQAGASGTTPPTGTWTPAVPSVSANQYLWTRTVITYTDGTTSTAYSVGKMGADGADGKAGAKGADGKGIKSTTVTYQASTSGTVTPTGIWSTTIPTVAANQYLWTKTVITYTDNTSSTSYSIGKIGANGSQGATGPKGSDGKGIKSTVIAYQASTSGTTVPSGTWGSNIPAVGANQYLWTRTTITYTDNTTSVGYSIGKMGANGAAGQKGSDGSDGIGVKAVVEEYYLSTSGTAQSGGSWSTAMPTWTSGKYIWTRSKVTWTDNTVTTTTPVLANAINSANSTATSAQSAANTAKTDASKALSAANSAKESATASAEKITSWCAANNKTLIDGGKIYVDQAFANSIFAKQAQIGGFNIGSTYLANNTSALAGAANSVYLGTNGISCGVNFKVDSAGTATMTNANIKDGVLDIRAAQLSEGGTAGYVRIRQGRISAGSYTATAQKNGIEIDQDNIFLFDQSDPNNLRLQLLNYDTVTKLKSVVIDRGTVGPFSTATGKVKDIAVKFNKTFTKIPTVVVGFNSSSASGTFGRCACSYKSSTITTTGFTVRVFNGDTVTREPSVNWIAIQT